MKQEKRVFYKEPDIISLTTELSPTYWAYWCYWKLQNSTLPPQCAAVTPWNPLPIVQEWFYPQGKGSQSWNSFLSCAVVSSCQKRYLTSSLFQLGEKMLLFPAECQKSSEVSCWNPLIWNIKQGGLFQLFLQQGEVKRGWGNLKRFLAEVVCSCFFHS